jgi:hypothetical protein
VYAIRDCGMKRYHQLECEICRNFQTDLSKVFPSICGICFFVERKRTVGSHQSILTHWKALKESVILFSKLFAEERSCRLLFCSSGKELQCLQDFSC